MLRLARLNAGLQRGYPNPLDQAILAGAAPVDAGARLGEIPYDFQRKRLSVLVDDHGTPLLVTKGAFDTVLQVCSSAEIDGRTVPLGQALAGLEQRFATLSGDGYRVLALASRALARSRLAGAADEAQMTLRGLLAFLDPPKPGAAQAIGRLAAGGVSVRLVTGDNRLAERLLTGAEIDRLDDAALADQVAGAVVFAEVEPLHKQRIVQALRSHQQIVGSSATGSTTPPRCTPSTSASRWTPRSTSPSRQPPSCCSTRAWTWWPTGSAWAGRPSPTPSSTGCP